MGPWFSSEGLGPVGDQPKTNALAVVFPFDHLTGSIGYMFNLYMNSRDIKQQKSFA